MENELRDFFYLKMFYATIQLLFMFSLQGAYIRTATKFEKVGLIVKIGSLFLLLNVFRSPYLYLVMIIIVLVINYVVREKVKKKHKNSLFRKK